MSTSVRRSWRATAAGIAALILLLTALVPSVVAAPEGDPRIIDGQPADLGEYPFMVALLREDREGSDFDTQFCGGSLIDARWVLTAAHCVDFLQSPSQLAVAVNRINLDSNQGTRVGVRAIYIHPDYNSSTGVPDVALLQLAKPVNGVETIQLADAADDVYETPGTLLTVIGWGNTSTTGQPSWPDHLQEQQVPVVSDAECDRVYWGIVTVEVELCAGEKRVDSCQGDSGGPLFATTSSGDWIQMGIVSWGFKCGKQHFPGVYTEVNSPTVREFIAEVAGV